MHRHPLLFALVVAGLILPQIAFAQDVTFSLGDDGSISARTIQLFALVTVLSLAPGLAICRSCGRRSACSNLRQTF